jgi:hypothetical protein
MSISFSMDESNIRNVPSSSTENLEYIRCPTVFIWAGNPGIYTIRHEEIRTASKGNLQTISMISAFCMSYFRFFTLRNMLCGVPIGFSSISSGDGRYISGASS